MNANYTGNQISERRKALGLTQKQLAEQLHVTDKAVSKWERGINFPDLGLMEALADALNTIPAALLGLEDADRDEIVKNMTEISADQLEDAQKHLRITGWLTIAAAVVLAIGFAQDEMYSLLGMLIPALIIGALYLLFKFGAIRKWDFSDWMIFYGALIPVVIFNFGFLVLDYGFPDAVNFICVGITAVFTQILFYRTMRDTWAKALPVLGLLAHSLWLLSGGGAPVDGLLCAGICFSVWLILRKLDKNAKPLPVLKITAAAAVGLVLFSIVFYDSLVKAYVNLRREHLVSYCQELLEENTPGSRNYGPWTVSVYPEDHMVEFLTGGSGIGAETSYSGFYYSAEDAHIPFQGADLPVDVYEPTGTGWWTDGTDNHGTTQRIWKYFYWFEASF